MACSDISWYQILTDAVKIANDGSSAAAAIAIVVAALSGRNALASWQKKKNLKRKMSQAVRTILAVRQIRKAFVRIRRKSIFPHERAEATNALNDMYKGDQRFSISEGYIVGMVFRSRSIKEQECFGEIEKCSLVSSIDLGDKLEDALNTIVNGYAKIAACSDSMIVFGHVGEDYSCDGVLFDGNPDEESEFIKGIYESIKLVENECKSILKSNDIR